MRIALYIQDGLEQIVLTPETNTEKSLLGNLHSAGRVLAVKKGSFFECRGGWTRFNEGGDESTMLILKPTTNSER